jgi:hypothetical protein
VASVLVFALGCLAGCGGPAASSPSSVNPSTIGSGESTVHVLQMNLCNSGRAGCYSGGRAISVAAAVIGRNRPDIVSLNEVCRENVDVLKVAMSAAFHGRPVASAFKPAEDRSTKAPVRCQDGQDFGDGVLAVAPSAAGRFRIYSGVYPIQDANDVEERVWVCVDLALQFFACTTHAASTNTTIALAQCRYLLSSAEQLVRRHDSGDRITVAGDFNVAAGGAPNPQACLPHGYKRADDGALQDVVASPSIAIRSRSVIDMHGATDHPALLVELVLSRR